MATGSGSTSPTRTTSTIGYHGEVGEIEAVLKDDLSGFTDDPRDDILYRVAFDHGSLGQMSCRHHDRERVE